MRSDMFSSDIDYFRKVCDYGSITSIEMRLVAHYNAWREGEYDFNDVFD